VEALVGGCGRSGRREGLVGGAETGPEGFGMWSLRRRAASESKAMAGVDDQDEAHARRSSLL